MLAMGLRNRRSDKRWAANSQTALHNLNLRMIPLDGASDYSSRDDRQICLTDDAAKRTTLPIESTFQFCRQRVINGSPSETVPEPLQRSLSDVTDHQPRCIAVRCQKSAVSGSSHCENDVAATVLRTAHAAGPRISRSAICLPSLIQSRIDNFGYSKCQRDFDGLPAVNSS